MEWISIEDELPEKGKNVLGFDGKQKRIVFFISKYYEEFLCDEDEPECCDYLEEKDMSYWKEGWYSDEEQSYSEYDSYWTVRKITHWMPLPEPPKTN